MEYSAGSLELSILGFSPKAVANIDVTAKALRRLASAVDKINNTQFVYAGDKLEVIFTKIARATNSINTRNIENLAIAAKSLSSISRISNLDKMDFAKVGQGFSTLSIAIQPFLDKVKEAEASLTALDGILRRSSGKKMQSLLGGGGTTSRGGISAFGRLAISTHLMRKMGRFAANLVQAGSDYYETLNLWQVAMRNNLDVADQFINKMNKAYGISTKTLMNAQAIFKNMVGNLGNVSDATAYALSEALVQMSVDFSSLYNVKLNEAFNKMQAMLARQVRPIRSVSGYDITENTIYELYQTLGGTKTMRQLNNTEKQLLSIYAVFKQMGASGALGDMTKTLNQFANQSRMMTEYWAELKTWSGLILKDLLEEWEVLKYVNAALITMTEIIKAIAKSRGLGEENFVTGLLETVDATNDAVDELQGKLLDFDKFRSLEGASSSPVAIGEKLIKAITGYSSFIDEAVNDAKILADTWLKFWLTEDGKITENGQRWLDIIKAIGIGLGVLLSAGALTGIAKIISSMKVLLSTTGMVVMAVSSIAIGFISLSSVWSDLTGLGKFVSLFITLAAAIGAAVVGLAIFSGNWAKALSLGAIIGGTTATIFSSFKGKDFAEPFFAANGASDIDGGTLFVAGEMGKTEAVYTGSNGKTNVANVRQMEQAFYNALSRHSKEGNGTIVVEAYLDGEKVYENTTARAKSRGNVWAKA